MHLFFTNPALKPNWILLDKWLTYLPLVKFRSKWEKNAKKYMHYNETRLRRRSWSRVVWQKKRLKILVNSYRSEPANIYRSRLKWQVKQTNEKNRMLLLAVDLIMMTLAAVVLFLWNLTEAHLIGTHISLFKTMSIYLRDNQTCKSV